MEAINSKHKAIVNRAVKHLKRYNHLNDMRDAADNDGNDRLCAKYNRQCEDAFAKFEDCLAEMPKREQNQIIKSDLY